MENVTAAGKYVNDLKNGEIYTAGSSSKLLSFFNGEFSNSDTKVVYNKKSGFSYLTEADGGVMGKIGDGNFSFNWNEANAGIVQSMNDEDLYHMGFGNEEIITIPPMQELSYEEFTGGKNGKGKGAIIKANSSGTARFYNQALYVEEEIIKGVDVEGNYTQVIKKPNVENLEALAIETANARIDGHLTTGPNSYKSLNAYFDNYFNPPVGPGRGISIDEFLKDFPVGTEKVTLEQAYLKNGTFGFIYNEKTKEYTEITRLEPESPTESMLMENYTQLPCDLLFKTESIDNMKTMMASINNKILGTYSEPDDATATPKDRTRTGYQFPKITPSKGDVSDNQFAAKFTSLNKPVVIDGKAQDYNQFDSNNKNIDYTKPDTGAPGLLNAIIKDPALSAYKSVITDNYLPMVSGGKVVISAHKKITDKYAALIGAQNRIPANTPLEKFPALIKLVVADAAKTDIDNVLDFHIRESQRLLKELMLKLYKRNPRELKKNNLKLPQEHIVRLFELEHTWDFPEFNGNYDINIINLTFSDRYKDDRVFSFIAGLTSMIMKSYNY